MQLGLSSPESTCHSKKKKKKIKPTTIFISHLPVFVEISGCVYGLMSTEGK